MFLALIFLSLSALGAYLFPEWSWAAILLTSFAGVATLRLILFFTGRPSQGAEKNDQS